MAGPPHILYFDQSQIDREKVWHVLEREDGAFQISAVATRAEFEARLTANAYDLILWGFDILDCEGMHLIDAIQAKAPGVPIIIIIPWSCEAAAIQALRRGAVDYIIKTPWYAERLPFTIRAVIERQRLQTKHQHTEESLQKTHVELQRITQDITEQKQAAQTLRESEAKFRTLSETLPVAIFIAQVVPHGLRIRYVNPAAEAITGYTREELLSLRAWDRIYPDSQKLFNQRLWSCFSGDQVPARYELKIVNKYGQDRWIVLSIASIEFEGQPAILGTALDITERKQAEAALQEERALLARRVTERTTDLSAANAELTRAAHLKDEFLASMSHELRTPLNAILGIAEALQEEIYGPLNPKQHDSLRHVEESGHHLLSLINDILDLSKIGAGKMVLEMGPVSVADVCNASIRLVKQEVHKKQLKLSASFDEQVTTIYADGRRLKQILVNLLSNAVKFTPEGGTIGINVLGDRTHNVIHITVWDTGIGISQDDIKRLFQPFVQLDGRLSKVHGGTGLGLALVYRMVEMHGGSVSVESVLEKGSRFTVSLPWKKPPEAIETIDHMIEDHSHTALSSIYRALIIEDSSTTAEQIARYLDELAVQAFIFSHGSGIIDKILELLPDIIILDIHLPDVNGWEVLQQIQANPRTRDIPTLIVSVEDERARGAAMGVTEYLVKPISRQQLRWALRRLASQEPKPRSAVSPPSPQPTRLVVLLAEDNKENIDLFSDYLLSEGYEVVVARNGLEAIERAKERRPDIILMDIQMPKLDGVEATRRIRADKDLANVPIIAITALAMPGDFEYCLDAGANEYLSKPISLQTLLNAIEAHLQAR